MCSRNWLYYTLSYGSLATTAFAADEPEATTEPEVTVEPEVTEEPAPTEEPEATAEPEEAADKTVDYYDPGTGTMKQVSAHVLTGSDTWWEAGWYVVQGAVTIEHADVAEDAEVNLILPMGSGLTVRNGFRLFPDSTLTIWGTEPDYHNDGELNVLGADRYCAGIGRVLNDAGNYVYLTVNGGRIRSQGGRDASGIGSGHADAGALITINRGLVIGHGGSHGAGIGGGSHTSARVYINGGTVAGYGGSESSGIGGDVAVWVTITGGKVYATSSWRGYGVNGVRDGLVTITGGSVKGTVRDPRDANGNTLYLAQVHNPNGQPVTINGKRWNINNGYDALCEDTKDTNLYVYLPASVTVADVVVGNGPIERYVLDAGQCWTRGSAGT